MNIKFNLEMLKNEIKKLVEQNDLNNDVTILAATKYVTVKEIKELVQLGVNNIGENKVQDFLKKYEELEHHPNIIWHFIGSLQTNKVNKIINKIDYLHSLDRENLAAEINKYATKPINCFIEVNCSGEDNKHGMNPEDVITFVETMAKYQNIRIVGLMTMAANTENEIVIRDSFRKLKHIQEQVINLKYDFAPCTQLSMGMSNDYHYAISEGSTLIRVGSKLFL